MNQSQKINNFQRELRVTYQETTNGKRALNDKVSDLSP